MRKRSKKKRNRAEISIEPPMIKDPSGDKMRFPTLDDLIIAVKKKYR